MIRTLLFSVALGNVICIIFLDLSKQLRSLHSVKDFYASADKIGSVQTCSLERLRHKYAGCLL